MTPKEEEAIAEVFRNFAQNESPASAEARPAVKYLLRLKGFSKVEDDIWSFFADCFRWFRDKEPVFASAEDAEVLRAVGERFRDYMKAKWAATAEPKAGQPWRPEPTPVETYSSGLVKKGRIASVNWKSLKKVSKAEKAQSARETKVEGRWLLRLKEKAKSAEIYQFWLRYIERRLRIAVERQHDPELRQEAAWRAAEVFSKSLRRASLKK